MQKIRKATADDAFAILEIYHPYVLKTPLTFEIEPPTPEEMKERILETSKNYPWLVFEEDGEIIGYAYASAFKTREAYRWSVESSVYVRDDHQGRGIGKQLYQELIVQLRDLGFVNVVGVVVLPNEASASLHESLGFQQVAKFKNIGFKLGKWWDVSYWQLELK